MCVFELEEGQQGYGAVPRTVAALSGIDEFTDSVDTMQVRLIQQRERRVCVCVYAFMFISDLLLAHVLHVCAAQLVKDYMSSTFV